MQFMNVLLVALYGLNQVELEMPQFLFNFTERSMRLHLELQAARHSPRCVRGLYHRSAIIQECGHARTLVFKRFLQRHFLQHCPRWKHPVPQLAPGGQHLGNGKTGRGTVAAPALSLSFRF